MQRIESQTERICRACQFENELGCEIPDEVFCNRCDASLNHDVLVAYEDNCPLCNTSFDDGKPHVFWASSSGVQRWLCQECLFSPRGAFYQEFHLHPSEPEAAPSCELCGGQPTLLPLTHSHPDGRLLCAACAETETGRQWVKEHYEPHWPDPAEKERLERVRQLLRASNTPFVEDADRILIARRDAASFVQQIFVHRWNLEALHGFTASSDGELHEQFDHCIWWKEPEVPTERGVLDAIQSHPLEVTHYEVFVEPGA